MQCPLCLVTKNQESLVVEQRQYWACAQCSLVWLDKNAHLEIAAEKSRYLEHQNDIENPVYLNYLDRLASAIRPLVRPSGKGLDFGCGPTEGMKALLTPQGFVVDSYDPIFFPAHELLKNRYDFVLCSEAAEHFFSPRLEFERLASLLSSGGWLGVSSQLLRSRAAFPQWSYRRDPTHVCFYSEATVAWIATHLGWEIQHLASPIWVLRKK